MRTRMQRYRLLWLARRWPHVTAAVTLVGVSFLLFLVISGISYLFPGGNGRVQKNPTVQIHDFVNPKLKNNLDLVKFAQYALNDKWGYVYGTYGQILDQPLLDSREQAYPDEVTPYLDFIHKNWVGGHVTDCAGLIKGYCWLEPDSGIIRYNTNHIPDLCADDIYKSAAEKGEINTMPNTPGLAVWMDGHIGVYIGNGNVIEAMTTTRGVVQTQLQGRGWKAWLKVPNLTYF